MNNIGDIQDELIRKITADNEIKEISQQFNSIKVITYKIIYVDTLLKKYKLLDNIVKFNGKNNEKSTELRKMGNEYFSLRNRNYVKALKFYNKSICWAESNSSNLAIGYANRSAVFFEWGEWQTCMDNIELARKCISFPENLKLKLDSREANCKEQLGKKTFDSETSTVSSIKIELSYPAHNRVPFIANCLELVEDEKFGRYVITNRDLNVGDLITIEKGFCLSLKECYTNERCLNCLSENLYSLIPCTKCSRVMFCSEKCRDECNRLFHRFECSAIDGLYDSFNKIHLVALRTVLKVFGDAEELKKIKTFVNTCNEREVNPFTVNYADSSISEQYKPVHTLATNESKRTVADLFNRSIIAAALSSLLKDNEYMQEIFLEDDSSNCYLFFELLHRHLQTSPTNFHSLDVVEMRGVESESLDYVSGAFPFCSMINHSCAPNIVRYEYDNQMLVFVFRTIGKGEQLFDNYGYHHAVKTHEERRTGLWQYQFRCECIACQKDYPVYGELPHPPEVPDIVTDDVMTRLFDFDHEYAIKAKDSFNKFLATYDTFYPCQQICSVQEGIKMCYNILLKNVPVCARYK